jgi:hypothetical protein
MAAAKTKKAAEQASSPANDKKAALETVMQRIEKECGKGSIMRLGENMAMNYRQIMAMRKGYENQIRKLCPDVADNSGIYVFWRIDEAGLKYAYVGQALHLCKRLVDHMCGYQYIDNSIRKHKLYDEETNIDGYRIEILEELPAEDLDERERYWIKYYADNGYQLKNQTIGGQDGNKLALGDAKSPKGYRDGLAQGYKNARRDVAKWFEKNLIYSINGKEGKLKQRAYDKFTEFLNVNKSDEEEDEI